MTNKTRRFIWLGRAFVAGLVLAVARYSVWFVHQQHQARLLSLGRTEADVWFTESQQACRMASMHDWLLDVLRPAHNYFERFPDRRDALIQFVTTLEVILLVFNLCLFVLKDAWIIVQTIVAFFAVLAIQSLWWSPIPCDAAQLAPGVAWFSDLLAGGNAVLPLGGISGSTVFVAVAMHNVWRQRRQLDTAILVAVCVACYSLYHLIMRWHYAFDELASILLAAAIVHQIQRARSLARLTAIHQKLQSLTVDLRVSAVSTPAAAVGRSLTVVTPTQTPVFTNKRAAGLQEVMRAYQTTERLENTNDEDDLQFELPKRASLHQVQIYPGSS